MVTPDDAVEEILTHAGWTRSEARAIVEDLVGSGKWSAEAILLGFRAGFTCEYCGQNLLADASSYKMWERDHLVPQHAGGLDEPSNLVLACTPCNAKFKNRWNPATIAASAERNVLLKASQDYVHSRRSETELELARLRKLFRLQS